MRPLSRVERLEHMRAVRASTCAACDLELSIELAHDTCRLRDQGAVIRRRRDPSHSGAACLYRHFDGSFAALSTQDIIDPFTGNNYHRQL